MYPQSMFLAKIRKIKKNNLKISSFTAVKYCCILHGRVCVMIGFYEDLTKIIIYHKIHTLFFLLTSVNAGFLVMH